MLKNKIMLFCLASLVGVTAAIAASNTQEINQILKQLLAKYNNDKSTFELVIKKAEVSATRAVAFAGSLKNSKVGKDLSAELSGTFSYSFPETKTAKPVLNAKVELKADILKLAEINKLSREKLNEFALDLKKFASDLVQTALKENGEAASVSIVTKNLKKDANGFVTALDISASVVINTSLLTKEALESLEVTSVKLKVNLDVAKGASVSGKVVMNPQYRYFKSEESGLKEMIEQLLAKNNDILSSISVMAEYVDQFITTTVNGQLGGG